MLGSAVLFPHSPKIRESPGKLKVESVPPLPPAVNTGILSAYQIIFTIRVPVNSSIPVQEPEFRVYNKVDPWFDPMTEFVKMVPPAFFV